MVTEGLELQISHSGSHRSATVQKLQSNNGCGIRSHDLSIRPSPKTSPSFFLDSQEFL